MYKLTKNGRPIINRETKLPVYTKSVDSRINNLYKELTGMTKSQAMKALSCQTVSNILKEEIKCVLFTSKLATIKSSMTSLSLK